MQRDDMLQKAVMKLTRIERLVPVVFGFGAVHHAIAKFNARVKRA